MADRTAWRGLTAATAGLDCDALVDALRATAGLSDQSERRLLEVICRFLRFLDGSGIDSLSMVSSAVVSEFVHARSSATGAEPSVATSHLRRSAVRLLFRVLRRAGALEHDPTLDLVLPARSSLRARPLSDDEIALGRSFSVSSLVETRRPAAWALAEATARTSEIAKVCVRDLDLETGRIWLPGGTKVEARWALLSRWGSQALQCRLDVIGREPGTPLVYEGDGSAESRQASACAAVAETLRRAGLGDEPDVRPISVAAWTGRNVFEQTGQIEAAARALGVRSLDRAAAMIGWDWTEPTSE